MDPVILGIGTALPEFSLSQHDSFSYAIELCCETRHQERVLQQLYRKTGISRRSTVLMKDIAVPTDFFAQKRKEEDNGPTTAMRMSKYREEVGGLASLSGRRALNAAGVTPESITHLVTASCTGVGAPGFDIELIESLALPRSVYRTHIGFMGCHGGMNALRVAAAFAKSDPKASVLVCATELCSLHFQYGWQSDSLVANSLFADGSASFVVGTYAAERSVPAIMRSKSFVIPGTLDAMTWTVSDHGFAMTLAPEVPSIIETYLPQFVESWLRESGLTIKDVGGWAVHPGGPKILDAVENSLALGGTALSHSRQILDRCGNMSSPTVFFILQELLSASVPLPYVVLGFGPGLTIEAALLSGSAAP